MHLSYYGNITGMEYMFYLDQKSENKFEQKYGKLTVELSKVIENYGLVGYNLLDIHDKFSMCNILMRIDKGNGYFYDPEKISNPKEKAIDYE